MLFLEKFKNKKSKIFIGITATLCIIISIYAFNKKDNIDVSSEDEIPYIETYVVPESEKVFINGIVLPKNSKDINLSEGEEIDKIKVENGQSVKKDDVLYTCKNQSIIDEISELKSQLSQLEASRNENDSYINIEINKLNSQIKSLNEKAYTTTYAPFDGKVYLNQSNENSQQTRSFATIQSNEFYMKGKASEQDLAKIKIDQTAKVLIFSNNKELMGRISFISEIPTEDTSLDYQQQSSLSYYDIHISFDSQDNLVNGFHVQASIKLDNSFTKIPVSCILEENDKHYVFKDLDGILKREFIDINSKTEEFAVISSGLKENDIILKNPTEEMQEGQSISLYENPDTTANKDITDDN